MHQPTHERVAVHTGNLDPDLPLSGGGVRFFGVDDRANSDGGACFGSVAPAGKSSDEEHRGANREQLQLVHATSFEASTGYRTQLSGCH